MIGAFDLEEFNRSSRTSRGIEVRVRIGDRYAVVIGPVDDDVRPVRRK